MSTLRLVQLSCPNCGGELQYTAGSPVASCPYCGSTIALVADQGQSVSMEGDNHRVLPFQQTAEQFKLAFLQYLSEGEFTPPDVFEAVRVRKQTGLFAALYLYEGTARVSWSAAAGFDRTESYVSSERKLVNGQWMDVPTTATRTVTDWRPVTGELLHDYRVLAMASSDIPSNVAHLVDDVQTLPARDDLKPVMADLLEGYALEPFTNTADKSFTDIGQGRLNGQLKAAVQARVPGDQSKQIQFSSQRSQERCTHLYRPLWLALYQYGGEQFVFAMDGSAGRTVGTRPEDTELKLSVEKLRASIATANVVALISGLIGLFVLPCISHVFIVGIWYWYTDTKKKELAIFEERMRSFEQQRAAALLATQQAGGDLPRA